MIRRTTGRRAGRRRHRAPAERPGLRRLLPTGLLAVAGLLLLGLGTPYAMGGFTTSIGNSTNTAQSGIFTCAGMATGAGAYFAWPFSETTGLTGAADVSGNNRPGTYSLTGVTYNVAGPCPRDAAKAITLNGTTGNVYQSSTTAVAGPNTFTEEIWFQTTTATGGKLIGFGSSRTGSSSSYDRHLYLTNAGNVVFGVYPNAVKTVVSPSTYRDGTWHQAVGTLAPAGSANPGQRLYVDGTLVASDSTVTSAQSFNGYWRVGYDNLASWTSTPTSSYFAGSLAWAQVYLTALTPDQVRGQYVAGTP